MNSTAGRSPRIFVLPGTPDCANFGDLALLQMAIERFCRLWPDAELRVLTRDPEALRRHCPEALPVPWKGRNRWLKMRALPRGLFPNVPEPCCRAFPLSAARSWRLVAWVWPGQLQLMRAFAQALFNADLVVLSGCGLLTDAFAHSALQMLDTLTVAHRCGIPTVLLSQGVGPMTRPNLLRRASEVLPRMDRVFLRERRAGLPLLQQWGMPAERIAVTGDDTVELAYRQRGAGLGREMGVSLRVASYSAVTPEALTAVRRVLADKTRTLQTRLVGLPIRFGRVDADTEALMPLLGDSGVAGERRRLQTPLDVIRRTSACRLVVTGSYHAGVFALAQGIPVVALAASDYYRDKFLGVADQFGAGCRVLTTQEQGFAHRLGEAVEEMWRQAPAVRPALLCAAEAQIAAAQAAYHRLPVLLAPKA